MGKKKKKLIKKKNKKTVWAIVAFSVIGLVGLVALVLGIVRVFTRDLAYEKDIAACDDKDYSSYIKVTEIEIPGNEYINKQIDIIWGAIQSVIDDNNVLAFGQLYEKYTELLAIQSQTKTIDKISDYSEAENAKNKCYTLADKQKESSLIWGIVFLSIGVALMIVDTKIYFKFLKPKTHLVP